MKMPLFSFGGRLVGISEHHSCCHGTGHNEQNQAQKTQRREEGSNEPVCFEIYFRIFAAHALKISQGYSVRQNAPNNITQYASDRNVHDFSFMAEITQIVCVFGVGPG